MSDLREITQLRQKSPTFELVSREAIIDAISAIGWDFSGSELSEVEPEELCKQLVKIRKDLIIRVKRVPVKQSEIIHCKDCIHFVRDDVEEYTPYGFYNTYFNAFCNKHFDIDMREYLEVKMDDYCSFAERKRQGID